jgi:hypothetical protein
MYSQLHRNNGNSNEKCNTDCGGVQRQSANPEHQKLQTTEMNAPDIQTEATATKEAVTTWT